ncbi:hypothetical protein CLI64_11155 [Nostoc sp. CENA543]|nr:hypothetical protein CLI64_11155 [Nostoc sp. CENA543]
MTKRKSIEDVEKGFRAERYTLLSKAYKNCSEKLEVRCPNGHEYQVSWNKFKGGNRCPKCVGKYRRTLDEVKELFAKDGCELLSQNFLNTKDTLEYKCDKGHTNKTTVNRWARGYKCPDCYGNKKKTYQDTYSYFSNYGYQIITLEKDYQNSQTKVACICPRGHEYHVAPSRFYRGDRCNTCAIMDRMGSNSPKWKEDKSWLQRLEDRSLPEYGNWRKEVYTRDKFTCQCCGDSRGGNLVAHHIINYSNNTFLAFEVTNGVTLCESCHIGFHKTYGYTNNSKTQLLEYYDHKRNIISARSGCYQTHPNHL